MMLSKFDHATAIARAGRLMDAVEYALSKAADDGAIVGISKSVKTKLCHKCDGTGYKDHASFAMDPCDHG